MIVFGGLVLRQLIILNLFAFFACLPTSAEVKKYPELNFKLDMNLLCQGTSQLSTYTTTNLASVPIFRAVDRAGDEQKAAHLNYHAILVRSALVTTKPASFFLDENAYTAEWFAKVHPGVTTRPSADPLTYEVSRSYASGNPLLVFLRKLNGTEFFNFHHQIEKYHSAHSEMMGPMTSWATAAVNAFATFANEQNPPADGAVYQLSTDFNYPIASEGNLTTYHPVTCGAQSKTLLLIHRIIWLKEKDPLFLIPHVETSFTDDIAVKLQGLATNLEK
jgi:hypothetical protein